MSSTFGPTDPLRVKLNGETARLHWHELLRHFAAGLVVLVGEGLDLIEVAVAFTNDDKQSVEKWMLAGQVAKASDAQAAAWLGSDARMWTVVVRPWILVQLQKPGDAIT